jgi:hypothetical protein
LVGLCFDRSLEDDDSENSNNLSAPRTQDNGCEMAQGENIFSDQQNN